MGTRAAAYYRISRDDKGDELGVDRQRTACRQRIATEGWALTEEYVDNDISASGRARKSRPQFARMLAEAEAGAFDVLVCSEQERFTRSTADLRPNLDRLRDAGVTVVFLDTGKVHATAAGRMVVGIRGVVAEHYSDYISEKVRAKKDELAARGLPSGGGSRPFGFDCDGLTVRADEAELVREAALRVLAGESPHTVALDWNARGVRSVTGNPWVPNTIRGILRSPRIAGLREHRGEVVGPAAWPAIVERDQWERVVRMLHRRPHRGSSRRRLLTGLLVCGRCGAQMLAGMNNGHRSYDCRSGAGFSGCGRMSIRAVDTEELIVAAVLARMDGASLPKPAPPGDGPPIADLEERLAELADLWADGAITRAEWLRARSGIEAQLEAARSTLDATTGADALDGLRRRGALRKAWPELGSERQRAVLAAIVASVIVGPAVRGRNRFDPDRVSVSWRA